MPGARDGSGRDRTFRRRLLLSWELLTKKQVDQCCHSLHRLIKDPWKISQAAGNGLQLAFFEIGCCFLESWRICNDIRVGDLNRVAQSMKHAKPALYKSVTWHISKNVLEINIFLGKGGEVGEVLRCVKVCNDMESEGEGELVPLLHNMAVMTPVAAQLSERLPEVRSGEAADTGIKPSLKQHMN